MRLKHYWASGGTVEFDPDSGDVTFGSGEAMLPVNWGSVWKQRGRWFALWHDGDSLVFQHQQDQWKLTPDVTLQVRGKFRRTFEISRDDGVKFQLSYWFKGAIAAYIDPTYDRLEEESDDFFLYVMTMWEYWKNRNADEFEALAREADLRPQ